MKLQASRLRIELQKLRNMRAPLPPPLGACHVEIRVSTPTRPKRGVLKGGGGGGPHNASNQKPQTSNSLSGCVSVVQVEGTMVLESLDLVCVMKCVKKSMSEIHAMIALKCVKCVLDNEKLREQLIVRMSRCNPGKGCSGT